MKIISPQLLFFVLLSVNVFSQKQVSHKQSKIDSLKQLYKLQISEFERGNLIYRNVFLHLIRENPDLAKEVANENYEIARSAKNLEAKANAEFNLSIVYLESSNYAIALRYSYAALKGYEVIKARQEARNNQEKTHNANINLTKVYLTIAQIHTNMKSYRQALDFCVKTINLKESMNEKDNLYYGVFLTRSNIAAFLKDYSMAINDLNIAREAFKEFPSFYIYIEYNLSDLYYDLFEDSNVDSLITILNIKKKEQLLDSALYLNKKVLKTAKEIKEAKWEAYAYHGFGKNAFFRKEYDTSISYYKKAIPIFRDKSKAGILRDSYKWLHKSYLASGDYNNSLTNYKKYISIRDTIESKENKRVLIEQNMVYEHEKEIKVKEDKIAAKNRLVVIVSISFVALLIILLLLIKRKRLLREKRLQKQFSQNLLTTQEEERKRISEDLHDGLGQSLLLVKNQLTVKNYDKSKELLTDSIEEMRSVVKTLYPFQLRRVGISIALENLIIQLDESYKNMDFVYEIEDIKGLLTIDQETNVFRIVQECLSNIIKHANADSAKVNLTFKDGKVNIQIQDNGRGFDVAQKNKELKTLGLKTIKERTDILNGTLEVDSTKDLGTSFVIKFSIVA